MSYPKQLLRLRPRRGQATDTPAWTVSPEFFTQADNVLFRQGLAERPPSLGAIYDPPSVAPYGLLNFQDGSTNYWIYVGATAAYAVNISTHTDITHASGQQSQTNPDRISLGLLNGVPFFNNALDEPMYWDANPANNFVDLPGWTATESCDLMVAHNFHLFALGIDGPSGNFDNQVKWSSAAAPGNVPASWTAAADNEAGDTTLSDTPGAIVSAANLRNSLAIYKNGATHLADYIGQPDVYQFRTLFGQAGALCRHAVADINQRHLVVTDGDIIVHDGQNIQSIADQRRRRYLFNSIDQSNFDRLFVVYYRLQNEVWICFPESGSDTCTRAMVWDIGNDAWGDRELPGVELGATGIVNDQAADETWDSDSDTWDVDSTVWNQQTYSELREELVLADASATDMLQVEAGSDSLTSTLGRHDLDFGDPERIKFVRRVYVRLEGQTSIDFAVRIGTRDATGESITWQSPVTMNSDQGFVDIYAAGRYVSVEVTVSTALTWQITGIDIEAEVRGYF